MHWSKRVCVVLCATPVALVASVLTLAATPVVLPVLAVSITLAARRFKRLRVGDVIGTWPLALSDVHRPSYIVLRPPSSRGATGGFRCLEVYHECHSPVLYEWANADDAFYHFYRVLPECFVDFVPVRRTGTAPLTEIAEQLLPGKCPQSILHDGSRWERLMVGKVAQQRARVAAFELLRPVRLIQRAWRAHAARRREAAARVITRAALHFLYRPGGKAHAAAALRWRDECGARGQCV